MERSQQIEAVVEAWFEGASRGDPSLVERHVSVEQANRLIGSDPDEWLSGSDVPHFLAGEATMSAGKASFVPSETEAFEEGTVGWAATRLTITLPDGSFVSPRWTAVLHKEDDVWRFVQTHASIGVPNDQVGWQYPG